MTAGSEEYRDSEKYEIRQRSLNDEHSIRELVSVVNHIRRQNVALQSNESLRFQQTDNEHLMAYSKRTSDRSNMILTVVNLDPNFAQGGHVTLDLHEFGLAENAEFQVCDLLTGQSYVWRGARNYVQLNPHMLPAHVLQVRP